MELTSKTAFYVSVILHTVIFVILIVWTLISYLFAKEDDFVFTMISPPTSSLQNEKRPIINEDTIVKPQVSEVEVEPLPSLETSAKGVGKNRVLDAFKEIALIDSSIKGFTNQNPWLGLRELTLNF